MDDNICPDIWWNSTKYKEDLDGYDKRWMATLFLTDSEILLRERKTWMAMTKEDDNTCIDRWWNSTKSKENMVSYHKGRWHHLSW